MGRLIKLLDKPLKVFTTYALIVLLVSIPVYFLIIDLIWVHEINEHNQIVAAETKKNLAELKLNPKETKSAITLWNSLHPETKIHQVQSLKVDSTYNIYRKDKYTQDGGYDRFQGLVTYFKINGQSYSLTVEANVEESYETIIAITVITIVFFIVLLVGFIMLNKRISQKLWKPFYRSLEQIKAFDLNSHTTIEFEESNIAEFEELNLSINKLVNSNVAVFRQQKEFTENASHELQTPLAIIQSKLDLLLQDAPLSPSQSRIMEETNRALSRISRVNKNLLLLARIENQQFLDKQLVNVSQAAQEIIELISDLFRDKIIDSDISPECMLEGNRILIEVMLTNLLMNACRHSATKANIMVLVSASELLVSNQGVEALNPDKLFRRFSAASVQTPGSGLGLSIVKEICNRYAWTVGYKFTAMRHVFTVKFKE
jgi:signal transduction histidine kinase